MAKRTAAQAVAAAEAVFEARIVANKTLRATTVGQTVDQALYELELKYEREAESLAAPKPKTKKPRRKKAR